MIEVVSLTKRYGGRGGYVAINDINLTVRDGSVFGLVGYNGAGKTTLLKVVAGIYKATSGAIKIKGRDVTQVGHRPGELFIVADEPWFMSQATPETMARYVRGYYPAWSDAIYEKLLEVFCLDKKAKIEGFSKGMQRQCGIALGFASGADALLLDESFDGLDLSKRRLIKSLLRGYARIRNAAVMITSHNLSEIEDIADDLGMIDGCHLIFCGSVDEVHRQHPGESLEEIFLAQGDSAIEMDVEALFA